MKTHFHIFFTSLWLSIGAGSIWSAPSDANQPAPTQIKELPAPTPYAVTARDANSRVWEQTVYEKSPTGEVIGKKHSYSELATGLNHLVNGQWVESSEQIDILPNGTAAATNGQHQAYFPGDIYSGVIELVEPSGQHLRSRPIGLSYFDGKNSVLIAELTNSVGIVVGNNQVVYPDAFTDVRASLRYTYTKSGFEQDVILYQQPPTPESLGLNPDTTRLEVLTEFFSPPQPTIQSSELSVQAGLALTDQSLGFGAMQMVPGRAFLLGNDAANAGAQVSKQWLLMDGRQFLVEEVPVDAIADGLAKLPLTAMNSGSAKTLHTAAKHRVLPPQRLAVNNAAKTMMLAKAKFPAQGFVLDYQTINSSLTNYTFQGDTTYYISGNVNLSGTNTVEGGAVLKYAAGTTIYAAYGGMNWLTSAYRPVVFTAKDDNSVGETITGSTGNPSGYYAQDVLNCYQITATISYFRVAYAKEALQAAYTAGINFYHGQLVNCQNGIQIQSGTVNMRNLLFANVQTNFPYINNATVGVQNSTFSGSSCLVRAAGYSSLNLQNCILANVTQLTNSGFSAFTLSGTNNGLYNSPAFGTATSSSPVYPFQTVGAGSFYLTNGCGFYDAGTTNIDATLLASLKQKTTYPPIVYSNLTFSIATNFSPQAQRDTNAPDLGYHYDPLDYAFGGVRAYSNVTFTAGTAVGWFEPPGYSYGLSAYDKVIVSLNGTAVQPCIVARYSTVQEGADGPWKAKGVLGGFVAQSLSGGYSMNPTNAAQMMPNFTRHFALSADPNFYRESSALIKVIANNSEFRVGNVGAYWEYLYFTNCLFERSSFGVYGNAWSICGMRNCTMRGGGVTLQKFGQTWPVWIEDCAFDRTALAIDDNSGGNTNISYCDFNAFVTNQNRLPGAGAHDVIVTNFNWQTSWLGNFYQPYGSPLIDIGSTTADQVGLYHYTTQADQSKEYNSTVDIGYHYVAVDGNGNPLDDGDHDGLPDYLEDANGNGAVDTGETSWQSATDLGLKVIITRPRNGSSLP